MLRRGLGGRLSCIGLCCGGLRFGRDIFDENFAYKGLGDS